MGELVITAGGPDRPGLVGEVTEHLFGVGVNIADSRMVNLRGHFALIALVQGADDALGEAREVLARDAARLGLSVSFATQPAPPPPRASVPYRLKTYSLDQPGIVYRVTSALKRHEVNIEELETRLESGPFMGAPLFTMELRLSVPAHVQIRELRAALETVSDAFNCDLDLEPA